MRRASRPIDVETLAITVPDMVEVVRFMVEAGRGPALVVSRRKITGALRARLRHMTADLVDEV